MSSARTGAWPVAALLLAAAVWMSATPAEARTLCAGEKGLNLRSGPSVKHGTVARLPAGACGIKVVGKCAAAGWCVVGLGDRRGWANTRLVNVREGRTTAKATAARPAPRRYALDDRRFLPPVRGVEPYGARYDWRYGGPYMRPIGLPGTFRYPPPFAPVYAGHPAMCVSGVGSRDTLRVRAGPGARHPTIWEIERGDCGVSIRGSCAGSWCPIHHRGVYGWVNASFLRPLYVR
jgi:uncharacterized protein YraI